MVKERIRYKEELPVEIVVADIQDWPLHFHSDIEIIYVLKGKVDLKCGYYMHTLSQGDVFIVNANEMHSVKSCGEPNMVLRMHLKTAYFSQYHPLLEESFFMTDNKTSDHESIEILTQTVSRIMIEIIEKGYGYQEKVIEDAHNVIDCLIGSFRYCSDPEKMPMSYIPGNRIITYRLDRIMRYMYQNYDRKLTLQEIADNEELSIYYLSHVIKEASELSFQELLNYIRVEESAKLLTKTNKRISAIASETGFSAVRYYIKHFESWYKMSPAEYREKYKDEEYKPENRGKYKLSSPEEIEAVFHQNAKQVYEEVMQYSKRPAIMIDVDLDELQEYQQEVFFPEKLFEREMMKPLARPYNLIRGLKESVIKSGENFMITTSAKDPKDIRSMIILVYNIGKNSIDILEDCVTKEQILENVKEINDETEFYIKIKGLTGNYTVSRYRMGKNNVMTAYEDAINKQNPTGRRQMIVNNWKTLPNISFGNVTTRDSLSLRSLLVGTSAELILVDKIE